MAATVRSTRPFPFLTNSVHPGYSLQSKSSFSAVPASSRPLTSRHRTCPGRASNSGIFRLRTSPPLLRYAPHSSLPSVQVTLLSKNSSGPSDALRPCLCAVGAFVHRDGEEVFQKLVHGDAHLLKYPCPAWAVDCRALGEASRRGVRRVVLYDKRVGTWWARLADFEEHGVPVNRDWGEQVALGLHWFSFLPLGSVTPQLTLFAEVVR